MGRSGLPGHYQGFNIPYEESRDRFFETLEILRKAWTQDRFSHDGRYYQFRDVCVIPKPYQKPHPPLRVAATTEETYPIMGRLGHRLFVAVRTNAISDLKRFIGGYHEAWREAGHPGRGEVALLVPVYVAETARQAREEPEASTMHWFRSIAEALKRSSTAARAGAGRAPGGGLLRRDPGRAGGLRDAGRGRGAPPDAARGAGVLQPVGLDERRGARSPTPACSARCASSRSAWPRGSPEPAGVTNRARAPQPSTPVGFDVPAGACDCHTHIHGDPATFPFFPGRVYTPEMALPEEMAALHRALRVERVVIVTPSVYGTDNSATLYGMRARGADARGVAVIDDATPESQLDAMDQAGVRGIRLNLATVDVTDPTVGRQRFRAAVERVKRRRWHVQLYTSPEMIAAIKDLVAASPVPVVFDHFGGARAEHGLEQPGFAELVELVRSGQAYVKISGGLSRLVARARLR